MFVLRSKGRFFYTRYTKELATYNSKTKLKCMLFDVEVVVSVVHFDFNVKKDNDIL